MSLLAQDEKSNPAQLMALSAPQNNITVNGSAGAAVLSAAIGKSFARIHPSVDMFVLPTVAGAVTSSTGHFCAAGGCYDIPMPDNTSKLSFLAKGTAAGEVHISALG